MKKKATNPAIVNRRARFDYELGDELMVGIELIGVEVRAARENHVQLRGAYVTIRGGELWLNNASFSVKNNQPNSPEARSVVDTPRRLLAKRKQIDELAERKKAGMTIVPVRLLTSGRFIKLVIAMGKGKKNYDKRETIKRRDLERDSRRNSQ